MNLKHISILCTLLTLGMILGGCKSPQTPPASLSEGGAPTAQVLERFEYAEPHMGMIFRIVLYHENEVLANQAAKAAFLRIEELNRVMSDYDPQSELSHFFDAPPGSEIPLSDDLFEVLSIAKKLAQQTHGDFDPTLGALTQLWRSCKKSKSLPSPDAIKEAQAHCGYSKLILNKKRKTGILKGKSIRLDLGGIGKGFASDKALETLKEHGVHSALVAASGDIAVSDPPPGKPGWTIQVETFTQSEDDPDAGNYIILLSNAAISTSGDINQFIEIEGKRYSHIVNPKTGLGLTHRVGATVVHPRATYSDALATIACIRGEKEAFAFFKKYPQARLRLAYLDEQDQRHYLASPDFPPSISSSLDSEQEE